MLHKRIRTCAGQARLGEGMRPRCLKAVLCHQELAGALLPSFFFPNEVKLMVECARVVCRKKEYLMP